jgi:hypothetical protein
LTSHKNILHVHVFINLYMSGWHLKLVCHLYWFWFTVWRYQDIKCHRFISIHLPTNVLTNKIILVTDKHYHIMLYRVHLNWVGFDLATLVVIDNDCIYSYKSNYHRITTMTAMYNFIHDTSSSALLKLFMTPFLWFWFTAWRYQDIKCHRFIDDCFNKQHHFDAWYHPVPDLDE